VFDDGDYGLYLLCPEWECDGCDCGLTDNEECNEECAARESSTIKKLSNNSYSDKLKIKSNLPIILNRDDTECGGQGPDVDCDGVCFGDAVEDECGICNGECYCDECDGNVYTISAGGGSYDSEIGWTLSNGEFSKIAGEMDVCLVDGSYTVTLLDTYGDGWDGANWTLSDEGGIYYSFTFTSGDSFTFEFTLPADYGSSLCTNCEHTYITNIAECCDSSYAQYGYSCTFLENTYGWDCSGCTCPGDYIACDDGEFDCGDGYGCIPGPYYCDGSAEYGNASWSADCGNGADEDLAEPSQ
jgi:hypothetical protein